MSQTGLSSGTVPGAVQLPPSAGAPAAPVTPYRANNVQEHVMADTTLDNILSFTPQAQGNFLIAISLRVITGATNVTVNITWTDANGTLQTDTRVSNQSIGIGTHDVPIKFINATTASPITVQFQASVANQVFATASIVGV